MTWQEVRQQFPDTWVLVEALDSSSQNGYWMIKKMSVLDTFLDAEAALDDYEKIHDQEPTRELVVLHTTREQLQIAKTHWFGVRSVA